MNLRASAPCGEICELTRSRRSFTTETRSTRRFTEQQSRNLKTSPQRRGERRAHPRERSRERDSAFLTPCTQDACAPTRTHKNPFQKANDFRVSPAKLRIRFSDFGREGTTSVVPSHDTGDFKGVSPFVCSRGIEFLRASP